MVFEPKLYNPAAQPEGWLIEHFVVRTKVFENLFDDLLHGDMKYPEQHFLIQGQRGMGKTTLLLRLKYEIERTPELNSWMLPIFFNEDSYDLTSLSNLWEKLLKYFDEYFNDGNQYYQATDKFIGRKDYEQRCFDLVIDVLNKKQRKIVLLFDNFGELFLDNLDEQESHRFREILMNCPDIRIVAASAVVLESQNDYSEPFFDFFRVINLNGLSKTETFDLIRKLQEKSENKIYIEANRARIETLAILTGGVIRTIIMLYEILLNDNDGSAFKDLESILDRVTPLYKHRMEGLKPQQRRIMDVIAKNWDALGVKEISEKIRDRGMPVASKIISAQLQELERNNFIEKRRTSTKNNLYLVKERFFNIWYLMRHGDKNSQCKVKWLTRFLEMWYADEKTGMDGYIQDYIGKLKTGNYIPTSAINITNALLSSTFTTPVHQAWLLKETENILSEPDMEYLPRIDEKVLELAVEKINNEQFKEAIGLLENINPKNFMVLACLGMAYYGANDDEKAILYLSQVEKISNDTFVIYFLAQAYYNVKLFNEAIATFNKLFPRNGVWIFIGKAYEMLGNFVLAEEFYLAGLEKEELKALINLGNLYLQTNNIEDAKRVLTSADEKYKEISYVELLLGFFYFNIGKYPECDEYLEKSLIHLANIRKYDGLYNANEIEMKAKSLLLISYVDKVRNKDIALKYCNDLLKSSFAIDEFTPFIASVFLWDNQFAESIVIIRGFIENDEQFNEEDSYWKLDQYMILLLAKKQYHSALKLFRENKINLIDRLKPTYYALMYLLKDEYPDEYLKMGGELDEPVKDILKNVEKYAIDYA